MSAKAASKVVKQLAGSGTGQSLMDRVTQAKYSLAGSGIGKAVAKATTEEIGAPKKKHIDYLVNCSSEPNVSIPLLAGLLVERTQEKSWVIVFKALITTHNLINFGNEKFSHYLASNNCPLDLPNFNDKSSSQSYEMSLFIRKYSKYLNAKNASYRAMAFDFCKVKRGNPYKSIIRVFENSVRDAWISRAFGLDYLLTRRDDGVLRTMPVDKLLKALPVMQTQILTLLEFDALQKDLNNAIINAAFLLLYKDLIRLFASYNEGMINLIEKYFTLKLKQCRLGLDLYHQFPELLSKVTNFMSLAESLGIGDKDSLGLQPVPDKVIQAMEQHLQILESKKGSDDESEDVTDGHRHKPNVPKKPVLPVPLPPHQPVSSNTTQIQNENQDQLNDESKVESTSSNKHTDVDSSHNPTIVLNDDGLPSALQEEIIAVATNNLTESITISNEAVKRSSQQTTINAPIHTQLGRSEHRTVAIKTGPPARSRSPSPARPAYIPGQSSPLPQKRPVSSISDGDTYDEGLQANDEIVDMKRNLSLLGLNNAPSSQTAGSPMCNSPFAGDEESAEPIKDYPVWGDKSNNAGFDSDFTTESFKPSHDDPVKSDISEKSNQSTNLPAKTVSQPEPTKSTTSAIDDLLGLDLLSSEPITPANIEPVPVSAVPVNSNLSTNTTAQISTQGGNKSALDDLLLLDPLLDNSSSVTDTNKSGTQSATNPPSCGINLLPTGLKPVTSTLPIRPAALSVAQNKNPLDALDSTLLNLASSLGAKESWGSSNTKKKPLSETSKPVI